MADNERGLYQVAYTDTLDNRKRKILENAGRIAGGFLTVAKDRKSYTCPKCGRGGNDSSHRDGLSMDTTKGGVYHCYSCGIAGKDIISLYMETTGKPFLDVMDDLEAMAGQTPARQAVEKPKQPPARVDYLSYYQKWAADIEKTDYHRGISLETLKRYMVGYCASWINPAIVGESWAKDTASPRLIIPTSRYTYLARRTDGKNNKKDYPKLFVGGRYPFNLKALQESTGKPVFVLEGEIDALSVIDCGGLAIGLGGNTGAKYLLKALQDNPFPYRLILVADADGKQDKAYTDLCEQVQRLGVSCEVLAGGSLFGTSKDANEALNADRLTFEANIQEAENTRKAELLNPWAGGVQSLIDKVQGGTYQPTPTGIDNLDKILSGGFMNQQLIGITGRPGAGKTAFCQFLVESMALNRADFSAVYLCFEMSAEQLQARSISRLMYSAGQDLAPIEILQGAGRWREGAAIYESLYADKVVYMGVGGGLHSSDIEEIERVVGECIRYNASIGRPVPYICIDYLQIVSVKGRNEFEAIGEIMARLKGLAVRYNTVVLLVIANNRDSNKKGENDMFSGRGSGSIEYGADVLLSLNPETLEEGERKENTRVTVKVAKGRWIEPNAEAYFEFNGKHMTYKPVNAVGRVLTSKEAKTVTDIVNQPDRQTELTGL